MGKLTELFGSLVFNDKEMNNRLSKETYVALKATRSNGKALSEKAADEIANAMKAWALENGATHYTHWFQPMTGLTGEKHDSFISVAKDGSIVEEFRGKELIKGEPDASSFPSGGMRATCEARGYTVWDPTSQVFILGSTMYIPTCFISFTGELLDKKTPLLRSMEALDVSATKVVKLFDPACENVTVTVGPEQEYFLIDKDLYAERKDIKYTGRTLFGTPPPKGQELEDQYFGSIRTRVMSYMEELDETLWKLGIISKTRHNEVAPAQHELAPLFETVNVASDHNLLVMEVMKKVAERHDFVCLLHEKPFKGINGSGKHDNWSMATSTGTNLFNPGKNPSENILFLLSVAATIKAVDVNQDLLRLAVASAGNDHRLGANEAPPAIISIYLGTDLTNVLDAIESGKAYVANSSTKTNINVTAVTDFEKDTADRNRTSPFAFTGNKFEFRALGSALNIACPNTILNTIAADVFNEFYAELSGSTDLVADAKKLVAKTYKAHKRIVFNGNNYSDEWINVESKKRGLLEIKSSPEAIALYTSEKNVALFDRIGIYNLRECEARKEILLEQYAKIINIEAHTMFKIASREILPSCAEYMSDLAAGINSKKAIGIESTYETDVLSKIASGVNEAYKLNNELDALRLTAAEMADLEKQTVYLHDVVMAKMEELRAVVDELELVVDKKYWPMPSYGDLIFYI